MIDLPIMSLGGPCGYSQPTQNAFDEINRPEHYIKNGIEVIDIIEGFKLNYRLGNVTKYVLRHQEKGNPLKDLKKARWYLNREIEILEKESHNKF
jgi:hypothetical protein